MALSFGPRPCPIPIPPFSIPLAVPSGSPPPSSQMDNVGQNLGAFLPTWRPRAKSGTGWVKPQGNSPAQKPSAPPGSHALVLIQPSCSSQHLLPTPTSRAGKPRWAGLRKALLGDPERTLPMGACAACPVLPFLRFLTWFKSLKLSKPQCPLLFSCQSL